MTNEELQAELESVKNQLRDSTRPWRHARWESIKADPQPLFIGLFFGLILGHVFGAWALKFIGF